MENNGFFLGINDIIAVIFKWLDKWVVLFFISVTQFAIYFNGAYEIPIFALMISAVGNIMLVDFSKQNILDSFHIQSLFKKSSLLLGAIVFPSFCFLFFYHTQFFSLVFSSKYIQAIPIFVISIFVLPVRITNYTAVLQTYHKGDIIVKGAILDILIAIILLVLLYPILKIPGIALAFVISTYVQAFYYLWETAKLINKKISYFFPIKNLLLLFLFSFIFTGISYFIVEHLYYPLNMILGMIICIIIISLFLMYYHYTNNKSSTNR